MTATLMIYTVRAFILFFSVSFLCDSVTDAIGIRPFGTASSGCPFVPTAITRINCPCELVGQACRCKGAVCIGPGGSLTGGIGNGNPPRGICGCLPGSFHNASIDQCVQNLTVSIANGQAGACLFLNDTVTNAVTNGNLTVSLTGGVRPVNFVLGVINSTVTGTNGPSLALSTYPLIAIDQNTGQVYVTAAPKITQPSNPPGLTLTDATQCYQVVAVDANNQVSPASIFCVKFFPFGGATCTCSTTPTTVAPNQCTCPN